MLCQVTELACCDDFISPVFATRFHVSRNLATFPAYHTVFDFVL
jgi:hypothetical protein